METSNKSGSGAVDSLVRVSVTKAWWSWRDLGSVMASGLLHALPLDQAPQRQCLGDVEGTAKRVGILAEIRMGYC